MWLLNTAQCHRTILALKLNLILWRLLCRIFILAAQLTSHKKLDLL